MADIMPPAEPSAQPPTSLLATRDTIASVLWCHAWNDYTGRCVCGWYVPAELRGDAIDAAHAQHQADALLASGVEDPS